MFQIYHICIYVYVIVNTCIKETFFFLSSELVRDRYCIIHIIITFHIYIYLYNILSYDNYG